MKIVLSELKTELGRKAALQGAEYIRKAISERGEASIVVATGASQFEMLNELTMQDIEWQKVTAFHLDEYIGISDRHPASFRKYLKERFADKVPLRKFHYISGDSDPDAECSRLGEIISRHPVDVAFIGIGENGHLAFNDPPADFLTDKPYLVVMLDEKCRQQQLGEGWFASLTDVPLKAISMSVSQIMQSKAIICTVPDRRKATAVFDAIEGEVHAGVPASILQQHPDAWIYLDGESASLLTGSLRS